MSEVASEWLFRYELIVPVGTPDREALAIADHLVHEVSVAWAEERKLGIGGGVYRKPNFKTFEADSPEFFCILEFGLMPTGDDETVSENLADELLDVLSRIAHKSNASLEGQHTAG